jgi:hypothetical protein
VRKNEKEKPLNNSQLQYENEKRQEKRKTIITLVLIVVAAIAGVFAMFAMLERAAHRDPGYYKLEAPKSDSAPLYAHDYTFEHYFEGESMAIKYAVEKCSNLYGDILLRIYKLTDARNQYENCKNIAYLNAHKGEEVELEKELFDILVSAYELTQAGEFNMFAGALNGAWNDIIYSSEPAEFDPLVNEAQNRRISLAVESAVSVPYFTFEIVDEANHIIKFGTTMGYKSFTEAADLGEAVIDLGRLRDAFIIDTVCALMEQQGYDNGYMTSISGVTKALSNMHSEGHEYVAHGLANGGAVQAFSLPMLAGSACCTLRSFGLEGELGYYTLQSDAGELLRSPNYSLKTGEVNDAVLTACAFIEKGSAVEAWIGAYPFSYARTLCFETSLGETTDSGSDSSRLALVSFILKDENGTVHVPRELMDRVKLLDDKAFSLSNLQGRSFVLG